MTGFTLPTPEDVAYWRQNALEAAVASRERFDCAPPCAFTPFVKSVYAVFNSETAGDPRYEDLPEREQRPWRFLAHAIKKRETERG